MATVYWISFYVVCMYMCVSTFVCVCTLSLWVYADECLILLCIMFFKCVLIEKHNNPFKIT